MYVAEQFAMTEPDALQVVADRGVGDLVTHGERGLDVTYLPFVLLPEDGGLRVLTTHLARTNLQWHDEGPAMWVVHGPDAYISPEIIPGRSSEHHEYQPGARAGMRAPTVPTWNYLVVHLKGRLVIHHEADWKLQSLYDMVARHEPSWQLSDGPLEAIEKMLPAIVGAEFIIEEVIGKAKMSQNRSSDEITSIAGSLAASGHSPETAEVMRRLALPYTAAREQRVAQARELKIQRSATGEGQQG